MLPIKPGFFDLTRNNPDLWGPFWITTSIIFLLTAAGNFERYI